MSTSRDGEDIVRRDSDTSIDSEEDRNALTPHRENGNLEEEIELTEMLNVDTTLDLASIHERPDQIRTNQTWFFGEGSALRKIVDVLVHPRKYLSKKKDVDEEDIYNILSLPNEHEESIKKKNVFNLWRFFEDRNLGNCCGLMRKRNFSNCFGLKKNPESHSNEKLGWVSGVFIPIVLDCFGVILFLRIPMIVGNAGILVSLIYFIVGYLLCTLSMLSASAIATNGVMKAGGSYFMISRILGPVIGAGVGIVIYLSNVAGTSLYILGFVDALLNSIPYFENFLGMDLYGSRLSVGTVLLFLTVIVCLIGPKLFEKATGVIFVILMLSIIAIILSFALLDLGLFSYAHKRIQDAGYSGWSFKTIWDNFFPNFIASGSGSSVLISNENSTCIEFDNYTCCNCSITISYGEVDVARTLGKDIETGESFTFSTLFGILFPACTGILAGTNLSGDLKDPATAIPKGSMAGIIFTYIVYNIIVIVVGSTTLRQGLVSNYLIEVVISFWPWITRIGLLAATISSALTSFLGASRVIYSIARDDLIPFLGWFGWTGSSILVTAVLVELCLLLGKVNLIAPFVTLFFVFTYGMINLACLVLVILQPPNFRPTFKCYSVWSCSIGFILCIFMMFFVDWLYATFSLVFTASLMVIVFLFTRKKKSNWGSVSKALLDYVTTSHQLKRKNYEGNNPKFWQFKALLCVSNPRSQFELINFFSQLTKRRGGYTVLGHVNIGDLREQFDLFQKDDAAFVKLINEKKWNAFQEIVFNKSVRVGIQNLLIGSGFGKMERHTIVLGWFDPQNHPFQRLSIRGDPCSISLNDFQELRMVPSVLTIDEYVEILKDSVILEKSIIVGRNFQNIDENLLVPVQKLQKIFAPKAYTIDIWVVLNSVSETFLNPSYQLMIQLAQMINSGGTKWKKYHRLRVMCIAHGEVDEEYEKKVWNEWLSKIRIVAEVKFFFLNDEDFPTEVDQTHSETTVSVGHNLIDSLSSIRKSASMSLFSKGGRAITVRDISVGKFTFPYQSPCLIYDNEGNEMKVADEAKMIGKLIDTHSKGAHCVLVQMPRFPEKFDDSGHLDYYKSMKTISSSIIPTLMVYSQKPVLSVSM